MSENNFDKMIKEHTDFKPESSNAELDSIKNYNEVKSSFFNPFMPFLISSSLVLIFVFSVFNKQENLNHPQIETEQLAEDFLFESYFAIEDDLRAMEMDEDTSI